MTTRTSKRLKTLFDLPISLSSHDEENERHFQVIEKFYDILILMSVKSKRTTFSPPIIDENVDYLVPLKYENPPRSISTSNSQSSGVFSSIYFLISLLIYVGIPIVQLILGFIYVGQCPVQPLIVIWMIVSGFAGILLVLIGILIYIPLERQSKLFMTKTIRFYNYPTIVKSLLPIFLVVLLFVIGWFFAGQVFVFEVKLRVEFFDSSLPEFCHANLYKSSYILIFVDYLIFLLVVVLNLLTCVAPPEPNSTMKNEKKRPPIRTTRI